MHATSPVTVTMTPVPKLQARGAQLSLIQFGIHRRHSSLSRFPKP